MCHINSIFYSTLLPPPVPSPNLSPHRSPLYLSFTLPFVFLCLPYISTLYLSCSPSFFPSLSPSASPSFYPFVCLSPLSLSPFPISIPLFCLPLSLPNPPFHSHFSVSPLPYSNFPYSCRSLPSMLPLPSSLPPSVYISLFLFAHRKLRVQLQR